MSSEKSKYAELLQNIAIGLSLLISVGTLIYTHSQLQVAKQGMLAQTWQSLTLPGYELSRVFLDHPDLRPYFYDGKACPKDDPNYGLVATVSEMHLDFFESFQDDYVFNLPDMEKGGKNRKLWDIYFRDSFATSPALCEYAVSRQHWYSMDFSAYLPTKQSVTQKKVAESEGTTQKVPAKPPLNK